MTDLLSRFDSNLLFTSKIFLIPVILFLIAFIEKKLGTVLGGALSGLPLVSGTLLCFTVFHQSYDDYSLSIYGAIEGVIALGIMVFAYSKMTYASSVGPDMTLSSKERWKIILKALAIYLLVSGLFALVQGKMNNLFVSNAIAPLFFIAIAAAFNFILYKKLPVIRPDDNKVNFKFKNSMYMAVIGTITFSIFSSIKSYGSDSALIGLISTAPFYLSVVIFMTHKLSTDYDVIHLNQGILIGFFGYILFFSIFLIGLTILHLEPKIVVPTAILFTIASYITYVIKFKKTNKDEMTRMSQITTSSIIPVETDFSEVSLDAARLDDEDYVDLQKKLLANKIEKNT